jgi:hypothetical protein
MSSTVCRECPFGELREPKFEQMGVYRDDADLTRFDCAGFGREAQHGTIWATFDIPARSCVPRSHRTG